MSLAELGDAGEGGRSWSSLCSLVLPKESLSLHQMEIHLPHTPALLKRSISHKNIPLPLLSAVLPRPFPPLPSSSKNSSGGFSAAWLIHGQAPAASGISQQLHNVSMAQFQESSSAQSWGGQGGHADDAGLLPPTEFFLLQEQRDFIPPTEEQGERGGGPACFRSQP